MPNLKKLPQGFPELAHENVTHKQMDGCTTCRHNGSINGCCWCGGIMRSKWIVWMCLQLKSHAHIYGCFPFRLLPYPTLCTKHRSPLPQRNKAALHMKKWPQANVNKPVKTDIVNDWNFLNENTMHIICTLYKLCKMAHFNPDGNCAVHCEWPFSSSRNRFLPLTVFVRYNDEVRW